VAADKLKQERPVHTLVERPKTAIQESACRDSLETTLMRIDNLSRKCQYIRSKKEMSSNDRRLQFENLLPNPDASLIFAAAFSMAFLDQLSSYHEQQQF